MRNGFCRFSWNGKPGQIFLSVTKKSGHAHSSMILIYKIMDLQGAVVVLRLRLEICLLHDGLARIVFPSLCYVRV